MSFFDMKKRRYGLSVIKLAKPTIKQIHRVIMPCKVNTPSGGPNNVTNKLKLQGSLTIVHGQRMYAYTAVCVYKHQRI